MCNKTRQVRSVPDAVLSVRQRACAVFMGVEVYARPINIASYLQVSNSRWSA
jgi:hypothetical protein